MSLVHARPPASNASRWAESLQVLSIWKREKGVALVDLKPITYRGGLVKFYVPSTWVEGYEPDGGGTFYEDLPNSGTLRLNVLTFENKSVSNDKTANDFLVNSDLTKQGVITPLPNGNVMLTYHKDSCKSS